MSWHPALGGSNRGPRANSDLILEPLGGSWWILGGLSPGLGSALALRPGCYEPAHEQHYFTPKRHRTINDTMLLQTPKHPHDIHYAIQRLDSLTRDHPTIFQKTQKALGKVTTQHAILHAINQHLQLDLNDLEIRKKKTRILLDLNTMFANVVSIKKSWEEAEKARREAEKEKARIAEKSDLTKAKEPSAEVTALSIFRTLQKVKIELCRFQ